ncbi:MAG TPA: hypothetical protein VH277_03265 [Gemmatimonadaceae bacterium]|nr:hypothetical protein [Gemmatimonadaceae bacterium]
MKRGIVVRIVFQQCAHVSPRFFESLFGDDLLLSRRALAARDGGERKACEACKATGGEE